MASHPYPSTMPPPPAEDELFLAQLAEPRHGGVLGPWLAGLVVCLMAGAAAVVLVMWLIPQELQRWRLAAAEERRLDGDLTGAVQQLDREIQADPDDIGLLLKRSQWLFEDRQYSAALLDTEQALSLDPENIEALQLRASIHQALGEFAKAVEDWKLILGQETVRSSPVRGVALNGLAYAHSLANIEIDQGLSHVDEAMRMQGENYAMLDTRGFLYYRQGNLERALTDLDNAVAFAEAEFARTSAASPPIADRRLKREFDRRQSQTLAVIRYHRSLVHDARQVRELAEEDRRRVRELGFEPDESLF